MAAADHEELTVERQGKAEMFLSDPKNAKFMASVMTEFKKCHDLVQSQVQGKDVVSLETREKIDQCATDFRYLCEQTAFVAHNHGAGWCQKAIRYFKNLERLRNSPRITKKLETEARKIAKSYVEIRNYCQRLSGEIDSLNKRTVTESQDFSSGFEDAHSFATEMLGEAEAQKERNRKEHEECTDRVKKAAIIGFLPIVGQIVLAVAVVQYFTSQKKYAVAHELVEASRREEGKTLEDLSEAQRLQQGVDEVVRLLDGVANMADIMAAYWLNQSAWFGSRADTIIELEEAVEAADGEDEFIAEELVEDFQKIKKSLLAYSEMAMVVCTQDNFLTDKTPTPLVCLSDEEFQVITNNAAEDNA